MLKFRMPFKDFLSKIFRTSNESNEHSARVRLELALEASGLVDWDFDYEKNTAYRSLKHDELYGYKSMLPNWNFENFFHHVLPEYHELAKEKFASLENQDKMEFDYQIRTVSGDIRWISLKAKSQKNPQGKVLRVAGVLKDITAEKESQEKLELQQRNLASLFEQAPEFFCIVNKDMVYEYVNQAHIHVTNGISMQNKPVNVPETSPTIKAVKEVLRTGKPVTFKNLRTLGHGREIFVDMIIAPRLDASGNIDGVFILGLDITDKIEALKQAEKSAAQVRLITNKLPAFVSYTDNEGRYQFMNEMYEKWFEKPVSEMLGKTREEITPKEYSIQSQPYESQALEGKPSHHEGTIKKENGELLNLDIHFVSDVDPETKEVRGMIAVGVDVTTQVNAVKEAELARRELHEIFMQAPAPMCLLMGPNHIFTMVNPMYTQFVKKDSSVLGKTLKEAFAGEDITYFEQIIEQVYRTGVPYFVSQAPADVLEENGEISKKFINVGYHAYVDTSGKPTGVLLIIQDVTEQVNSVVARDNFMGIASHELKTPLTAMKLQMQMNQKMLELDGLEVFNEDRLNKIFAGSITQVDRLTRLVDDMLDMSKISAEKLNMHFIPTDFSRLVNESFKNFAPQFRSVGIELNLDIEEGIIFNLDEARMDQVLTNLITNAIRYAPGKPLLVSLKKSQDEITLRVKDNGMGIDPIYHEKIFERFERAHAKRDISGMGLGLYISKQIIESHNGKIIVLSEPGKGSEFIITLPLKF